MLTDGSPAVVVGDHITGWARGGYGPRRARPPAGMASVLTPPSTVAALRAGDAVQIDPTAR